MRAALLFILLFLAHVGRSPAEAFPTGPGGCSALTGHGAGSYLSADWGYWKLVHDGGSVGPNDRVVLKLYSVLSNLYPGGAHKFKGFILKTSAGTLAVKDATNTAETGMCTGAIGHINADEKTQVDAYLDLPATTGTVTVTAEIVQSKTSVSLLTLDIEVYPTWTKFGDNILGGEDIASEWDAVGYSVSMSSDGTRMAIGHSGGLGVFKYDSTAGAAWQKMGSISANFGYRTTASISSDGMRVASGLVTSEGSVYVHEWNSESQTWTNIVPNSIGLVPMLASPVISRDGTRVAWIRDLVSDVQLKCLRNWFGCDMVSGWSGEATT